MRGTKEIEYGNHPMTHTDMMESLDRLCEQYPFIGITTLGESILGRSLPLITLGEGERSVLYIGAHSGSDPQSTALLFRFLQEFCEQYQMGGRMYQYSLPYLFSARTIYILPMLNPDGVEYHINGIMSEHILYERVCAMNGGSDDLHDWQANARGVDLNHNYNYEFASYKKQEASLGILGGAPCGFSGESPESEPEIGTLCNFLRYRGDIRAVLSLHPGKEKNAKIVYTAGKKTAPRSLALGKAISRMTGYPLAPYDGWESVGGMSAWCIDELGIPAYSIACSGEESDSFRSYATLRETLFTLPTMI